MYAVRNHIVTRLNEWGESGLLSRLESLRPALSYVEKLIEKAPIEGEALTIAIIDIGLKLSTLLATMDRPSTDPSLQDQGQLAATMTQQVHELQSSLEQFDVIAGATLMMVGEEDLKGLKAVEGE